jgi:hypothetical protein
MFSKQYMSMHQRVFWTNYFLLSPVYTVQVKIGSIYEYVRSSGFRWEYFKSLDITVPNFRAESIRFSLGTQFSLLLTCTI